MTRQMMISLKSVLFTATVFLLNSGNCQNPGIAVRINEQGLDAVSEYGAQELRNYLSNFQIPNIVYDSYNIDNIHVVSVDLGKVTIRPSAPNSITASISGASIDVTASWSASIYILFGENHFEGDVTASLSGVSISQEVLVGRNEYSGPSLSVGECSASIETLHLNAHYSGWFSWFITSVVTSLEPIVKKQIAKKICPGLAGELKRYFKIGDSQFPVNIPIKDILLPFDNIDVNVGLTSAPQITNTSITVQIAGRCYDVIYNPDQIFTFSPPPLPAFSPSEEMAQGMLSDYVLNTLLFSLWQTDGYLIKVNETQINSLADVEISTNTLAEHVSEFYFYIGRPVEFAFQSPEAVHVSINSSGVTGVGATNMVVYAVMQDGELEPIVAVNFSLTATFELVIDDSNIFGNMTSLEVKTTSEGETSEYFEDFLDEHNEEIIRSFNEIANAKKAKLVLFEQFQITRPSIGYELNAVEAAGSVDRVR